MNNLWNQHLIDCFEINRFLMENHLQELGIGKNSRDIWLTIWDRGFHSSNPWSELLSNLWVSSTEARFFAVFFGIQVQYGPETHGIDMLSDRYMIYVCISLYICIVILEWIEYADVQNSSWNGNNFEQSMWIETLCFACEFRISTGQVPILWIKSSFLLLKVAMLIQSCLTHVFVHVLKTTGKNPPANFWSIYQFATISWP